MFKGEDMFWRFGVPVDWGIRWKVCGGQIDEGVSADNSEGIPDLDVVYERF
jgi:hypothetical protein